MKDLADELERLAKEATPGEWIAKDNADETATQIRSSLRLLADCHSYRHGGAPNADQRRANAALIVALRNALPDILSALRGEQWQGIETHDGSDDPVLISVAGIVGEARLLEYMDRREWWWAGEGPGDAFADPVAAPPTHWRPLPPPPKGTDG